MAPCILLVDDADFVRAAIAGVLRLNGFDVDCAASAAAAVAILDEHRPAALLTDFQMPDCDGLCLLRRVRARPDLATLPAAVFSGAFVDDTVCAEAQRLTARIYAPIVRPRDFVRAAEELAHFAAHVAGGADLSELCRAAPHWPAGPPDGW